MAPPTTMMPFSGAFAALLHRVQAAGLFVIAPTIMFAVVACAGIRFLLRAQRRRIRQRISTKFDPDGSLHFLNALLTHSRTPLVILGTRVDFFNGRFLYQQCLEGPHASAVVQAVETLEQVGQSFELSTQTVDGRIVDIRGLPIGHRAVLFLQDRGSSDPDIPFGKILDEIPAPIWIRSGTLSLRWANRAFLAAVDSKTLQNALASDAVLISSEVELATSALSSQSSVEVKRFAVPGGQRRTLAINLLPLPDASVLGIATDVSEITEARTEAALAADMHADVLERLPLCVATFDTNQRLTHYNRKYARFWDLPEAWLNTHPMYGEVLARLREQRKLPEQRDFAAWKRDQVKVLDQFEERNDEFWHLPGGKSICVTMQPLLQGGTLILFSDVTERLHLESSLGLLTQVHRATLDTLDEGIAIFGSDGRLVLSNAHFLTLWKLRDQELSHQPHITQIAYLCERRTGSDGIWSMICASVNSIDLERCGRWRKTTRADGRIISLCSTRLPNGATVVTFVDLTDLERFEALAREALQDSKLADAQ